MYVIDWTFVSIFEMDFIKTRYIESNIKINCVKRLSIV